nr:uncharacterized protein At1g04910-like isoform X2 [Ipomoea trifida]
MASKIGIDYGATTDAHTPTSPPHRHSRRKLQLHYRRRRILLRCSLLLLPLLYFSGLISCLRPLFSLFHTPSPQAAVYRSHEIFRRLWTDIDADNSSTRELSHVWIYKRKLREQRHCSNTSAALRLGISFFRLFILFLTLFIVRWIASENGWFLSGYSS